ncbi:MAG: tRNA(fMet)-specific endonuclease VapC [Candidatus Bathyarchaeota archaeon BA1]|nr:MAG: tRNA(fMet)-specific endonuclease VapC [Candidatus Bathyarchaeota archaeon BA1]
MAEVLDTRFLIEHFYSDDAETKRKTSKRLRELTERQKGILPTIVIGEVVRITCEKRGKEEAEARHLLLIRSGLQIQDLDQDIAREAGLLKCRYRNVPMGDCIIATTATMKRAKVLSDDPHFDVMREIKRTWI